MSNQQHPRCMPPKSTRLHLSDDEFHQVLLIIKEESRLLDLYDVVRVISYTGIRSRELSKLRWADVDIAKSRIAVPSKTLYKRYVPFGPKTLQVLEARRVRKPASEFVLGESPTGLLGRISRQLRAVAEQAGIGPITLSIIRCTIIERLVSAGACIQSLGLISGYRTAHLTTKFFLPNEQVYKQAVRDQARIEEQE